MLVLPTIKFKMLENTIMYDVKPNYCKHILRKNIILDERGNGFILFCQFVQ